MKSFIRLHVLLVASAALLITVATGCNRDGIKVYHVDADDAANPAPPPPAAPAAMPATMPPGMPTPDNSGLPQLQYTVPAGWQQKAPSVMRVASFGISQGGKQADISVIPLGGMAGTDPANVNRWRGQVGLEALPDADIAGLAEKVSVGDAPADLYDLTGTAPGSSAAERIIAVILHRDDTSWFFKMTGDAALVEQAKPDFIAFLKSVSFGAPAAPAADTSSLPMWTIPTGWQPAPLEQFLLAKFSIAGANGGQAAVNVSSLGGDGGGLLPNINRWRGQLGLAPVSDADVAGLPTIAASGGQATVVDVAGTSGGQPARLVGVILPRGGQTWFYKLMGDADVVAQQKDVLLKFVQSAKYPDAH